VKIGNRRIVLTRSEFRLLHFLASHAGFVYTREQISAVLGGTTNQAAGRAADALLVGLRRRLGAAGRYIETVRGIGYKFRD
jgi:two-component system phosphate regulon response regulator PhoB